MLIATTALAFALTQQPAEAPTAELAVIDARVGACSADFTVRDANAAPMYGATVRVRIRYGFMGVKRMDLEVGTNSDGKARVAGLPSGTRSLSYDIGKADKRTTVTQDLSSNCQATYEVSLK